jgi:hypothetical protein
MLELRNVLNIKVEKALKNVFLTSHYPKKGSENFFGMFYFRKKTTPQPDIARHALLIFTTFLSRTDSFCIYTKMCCIAIYCN